jgi:hypothetical protein
MNGRRLFPLLASLVILASACTQENTGDEGSSSTAPQGLNRFLLFPNPLAMDTGGFETNTSAYADAYYRAIDPNNLKNTIDRWKQQNGFGSGAGTEKLAVFRDTKDLGYGRRMTGRQNTDGSIAFFVENYNVAPNGSSGYASILNVEAAIRRDTRWHVGTNAIEWSSAACTPADPADCDGTVKFAKYYNFSSKDGTRQTAVDLDGNGLKAMPGPCITCHGGRGDPLTPDEGTPREAALPAGREQRVEKARRRAGTAARHERRQLRLLARHPELFQDGPAGDAEAVQSVDPVHLPDPRRGSGLRRGRLPRRRRPERVAGNRGRDDQVLVRR